jgi:hypothetical protein
MLAKNRYILKCQETENERKIWQLAKIRLWTLFLFSFVSIARHVRYIGSILRILCIYNKFIFDSSTKILCQWDETETTNPPKIGSQPRCFIYNEANVTLLCCQPSFCTKWNNPEIYLIDYTLKDLNVLVSKCCFCFSVTPRN